MEIIVAFAIAYVVTVSCLIWMIRNQNQTNRENYKMISSLINSDKFNIPIESPQPIELSDEVKELMQYMKSVQEETIND